MPYLFVLVRLCLVVVLTSVVSCSASTAGVLVEAESFDSLGGWVLDQQFMDQMGSPFILAHGSGIPVADATTKTPADHFITFSIILFPVLEFLNPDFSLSRPSCWPDRENPPVWAGSNGAGQ